MNNDLKPSTYDVMGSDVFLRVPFYKRESEVGILYINPRLYEKIFNKKYSYEEAKKDIIDNFSVTLEGIGNIQGYGYVDRQGDPTDIALNGNLGSGRAFYLYENCNVKGTKTPFATSLRDDYNNGKYSLDCAIQECIISNVLNSSKFDTFETLAVIDLKENYLFPHTSEELPCGLIIRYYEKNELYRFSHRFVNNKMFKREELLEVAQKIGELEGLKFIERFLHGAWSIGNISIDANMIDLDTSFYVKGRHPEWTYTDKYITNYFGYEHLGQLMVLDTILNSDLNVDKVTSDEVKKLLDNSRIKAIRKNFVSLIGYDKNIYEKYKEYFGILADEFYKLSRVMFDNYDNLNCLDQGSDKTNLFDFSNFFRYYEILKQSENWSINEGLKILINQEAESLTYLYDNDEYHDKIHEFFKDIIIDDEDDYLNFIKKSIKFIELFDMVNDLISEQEKVNEQEKLIRAYLENEDKKYLMAKKWIRAELIDVAKYQGDEITNEMINTIIEFYSKKDYRDNNLKCDLTLFEEGIIFREISKSGVNRFVLKLFNEPFVNNYILNINGQEYMLTKSSDGHFYSEYQDNTKLTKIDSLNVYSDDKSYQFTEIGRDLKIIREQQQNKKLEKKEVI